MENIRKEKRAVSILLIFLMVMSLLMPLASGIENAASTITVTYGGGVYSYNSSGGKPAENIHGKFSTSDGGIAYCAEHAIPTPMAETVGAKATLSMAEYTGTNANQIKKILYYGYGGPGQWSGFASSTYNSVYQLFSGNAASSKTEACGIAVTAMALTKAYNAAGGSGRVYDVSGLSAFESYIASQPVPKGFTIYRISDGNSNTQDLFTWEYSPEGYLKVKKTAAESTSYSLAGATYGVYSDSGCKNIIDTLTTKSSGETETIALESQRVYVKETKAPTGFKLDTKVYTVDIEPGETSTVNSVEEIATGYAKVKKIASETELMEACPGNYSLAGAKYGVYNNSSLTSRVATLTTTSTGETNTVQLTAGKTYWIKEISPSTGFELDTKTYSVTIEPNKTATITSTEPILTDPMTILLQKKDMGGSDGTDSPSLEGAEFTVNYYTEITDDVSGLEPERTWVFRTNKAGMIQLRDSFKVGGDPLYYDKNGAPAGLKGTYEIFESKAPEGYIINDEHFIRTLEQQGQTLVYNEPVVPEYRKEFRINFIKNDADLDENTAQGDSSLAGAVYGVYKNGDLLDTYTTDANGQFTTSYYTCDSGFTMKELTPPEGYLLNETVYDIDGTEPGEFTVRYNDVDVELPDTVIKGRIGLTKTIGGTDESTQYKPEIGAEFQVYLKSAGSYEAAADYEKDVITTNRDGYAETKDLPYGTYIVHQTKGIEGHEFVEDFEVVISADGEVYRYIMNNAKVRADLRVEKVDAETGKTITADSAQFKIWSVDDEEWVSFDINYPNPYVLDVFETDEFGSFQLPEPLMYGNYELVEIKAPENYVLSKERIPFTVDGSQEAISIKMENMPQKGTITIEKTGEILASWTANDDGTYTPVFEIGGLPGTVYEIYADGDIVTGDKTVRYTDGQLVATMTTGDDGKAISPELYLGSYIVTEKTASEGYVINDQKFEVTLTYGGQDVELVNEDLSVENVRQKVEISFKKSIEIDDVYRGEDIDEHITFGLFATEEIVAADGSSVPADGLIETTGLSQNLIELLAGDYSGEFKTDLPLGAYYIQEIATDEGYILDDTKYDVSFEYAGQDTELVEIEANNGEAIENNLIRGDIIGHKVTEDGTDLEGAVIGLFYDDETDFTAANAIMTSTSDENGAFGFYDVPYGRYIVCEIETVEGCILNDTPYEVIIDEDGEAINIEIENEFQMGRIIIEKTGEILMSWENNDDGTYTPVYEEGGLEGVKFEIKAAEDIYTPDGVLQYSQGELIETLVTDENGRAESKEMYLGNYEVQEVETVYGYVLDSTIHTIALEYAGDTESIVEEALDIFNVRQKVDISLIKNIEGDDIYGIHPDESSKNVSFGIFAKEEIVASDGSSIPADGTIEVIGVEKAGELFEGHFTVDIPNGLYYVKEIAKDEHYITNDTVYDVDFSYTDPTLDTVTIAVNDGEAIDNTLIRGDVIGYKTGDKDKPLAGAVFGIFNKGENQFTAENAIMTSTSDENGAFGFYDVPYGKYIVAEISAPSGYMLSGEPHEIFIGEDMQVIEISAKNAPKIGYVELTFDGGSMDEYTGSMPKTGDNNNMMFWIALITLAFASTFIMTIKQKESRKEKRG